MSESSIQLSWTILSEVSVSEEMKALIIPRETILAAFKTLRDVALLTDHRWLFHNTQGVTGVKKETFSLPLRSIVSWSLQNAGIAGAEGLLVLHTPDGDLHIKVNRSVDFQRLDQLIAQAVL